LCVLSHPMRCPRMVDPNLFFLRLVLHGWLLFINVVAWLTFIIAL
jgi:hypothetical protein